jgi:hypothetical protein
VFIGAIENNPPQVRLGSPLIDYVLLWDPQRVAPLPHSASFRSSRRRRAGCGSSGAIQRGDPALELPGTVR